MSVVGNALIEEAIYNLFTVDDETFQKVEVGQFPESLVPGLNVAVMRGRFTRQDMGSYSQRVDIILLISACNIGSESECRKIVHKMVEYAVRKLVGTTFDLDIDPIDPEGWDEKTNVDQHELGEVVFEARFSTASSIPDGPISDEEEVDMREIFAEYALLQKPKQMQAGDPITSTQVFTTEEGIP